MATKDQCDFFRFLHDEEERRYEQLEARGKLYLSIVTLFLATLIFKAQDVRASVKELNVPWWLVLAEAVLLAVTLFFIVLGALIRDYEGVADPERVLESFGEEPPSDDEFFDDRIADYAVSTNRNAAVNDRVARHLEIAGLILGAAMVLMVIAFAVALLH